MVVTIRVPTQLVNRCFLIILPWEAPKALAAVTNSCYFSVRICPLTIRAIPTQYNSEKTINMLISPVPTTLIHSKPEHSRQTPSMDA